MRIMLQVEMDTEVSNQIIKDGRMGEVVSGILAGLQPEAAYFYAGRGGHRALTVVVEAADGAALPSLAEPFWLQLGAHVEVSPCMNVEELAAGLGRLG